MVQADRRLDVASLRFAYTVSILHQRLHARSLHRHPVSPPAAFFLGTWVASDGRLAVQQENSRHGIGHVLRQEVSSTPAFMLSATLYRNTLEGGSAQRRRDGAPARQKIPC